MGNKHIGITPYATFRFAIDGTQIPELLAIYDCLENDTKYSYSIAHRYHATGVSPGAHNVTVMVSVVGSFTEVFTYVNVLTVRIL